MKQAAAAISLILLAACARSEDASVRPAESNEGYNSVERVRAQDTGDQEPALGEWRRALQEERPALEFGPAGTAPLLSFACGERGGLVLQRPGALASGAAPTVSVTVGGQGRQLPVVAVSGATPMQRADIPAGDTLLQQLAGAQAPIALRFGDGTPLILPHSPLIGEFARSCASGGGREAGAAAPAGNAQAAAPEAAAGNETNAAATR